MKICGNSIGDGQPVFIIAGPCVIETYDVAIKTADKIARLSQKYDILSIYKSSFLKGNRNRYDSYRGPGLDEGLRILSMIKETTGLPITTDVHSPLQVAAVSEVADLIQVPAFLVRQSDLVETAARSLRPVHFKKSQFMSPFDVRYLKEKAENAARDANVDIDKFLFCERGSCFGYDNLVVDMRSFQIMKDIGCTVTFDASHSTLTPHERYSIDRPSKFSSVLAKAAVAAGADGIFIETHPTPDEAKCDARTQLPLSELESMITDIKRVEEAVRH